MSVALVSTRALAEQQLRAINHRLVNARAVPDAGFVAELVSTDFLLLDAGGRWLNRSAFLSTVAREATGLHDDDVRVRLFGTVALVHGVLDGPGARAAPLRYTDVYHWDGERWWLVGAQNTALQAGVARSVQQGRTPPFARWRGSEPAGDSRAVLLALNDHYVRAFRETDVAWYDAHLSPDYLVTNGDGSFCDRAQALANFARPVFASTMRSFPVDQVRIRRFDDVALIHAENAYELQDGRRGVSRYTDIWHQQEGGGWLCVTAHVTRHRAPA